MNGETLALGVTALLAVASVTAPMSRGSAARSLEQRASSLLNGFVIHRHGATQIATGIVKSAHTREDVISIAGRRFVNEVWNAKWGDEIPEGALGVRLRQRIIDHLVRRWQAAKRELIYQGVIRRAMDAAVRDLHQAQIEAPSDLRAALGGRIAAAYGAHLAEGDEP